MLFATVNGAKVEAKPQSNGICPLCERSVFSKCGEINVWHWAHHKDESCDSWYEPETEWHKNWKLVFGKEFCEIVISKNGSRHIADIQTKGNVIIELQNSQIQKPIIRKRELFYGERMLWVINGIKFKDNFDIYMSDIYTASIYEDLEYYRLHNPLAKQSAIAYEPNKELSFSWSWARKSWSDVQRPVFIDFGDENLFFVKDGMGTSTGKGIKISKSDFIKKYEGDINLLETVVGNKRKSSIKSSISF
jgi:competence protein CoiA